MSRVIKNILTLTGGTVVAQLIAILVQPVLRRIIPVEDFGVYAVYMSVVGIFSTIVTLRYHIAIVIPKSEKEASELVIGGISISILSSIILLIILISAQNTLLRWLNIEKDFYWWFYFLPLSVFLAGNYLVINNWLVRIGKFNISATNKVIRRTGEGISQIGFAIKNNSFGLVLGDIFGSFINNIIGIIQLYKTGIMLKDITYKSIIHTLIKYVEFPKYNFLPFLFNNAALMLPVIIVNRAFSQEVTGHFDLTRQVLAVTLGLLSASISQVYLQRIAEKKNKNQKILKDILKASKYMGAIAIGIVLIILFGGKFLFSLVFGSEYLISGIYAKIIIVSYAMRFIASSLSVVFISLQKLKINAVWQISYFLTILILFFIKFQTITDFLYSYLIIDLVMYLVYYVLIILKTIEYDKSIS